MHKGGVANGELVGAWKRVSGEIFNGLSEEVDSNLFLQHHHNDRVDA